MSDLSDDISYVRVDKQYFEENSHFTEMLDQDNPDEQNKRMYLYLAVIYENNTFLVPLRTNMESNRSFGKIGFNVPSSTRPNAGLDYRKILVINDRKHISEIMNGGTDGVSSSQQRIIRENYSVICKEVEAYVKGYTVAALKGREKRNPKFCFSSLHNFHEELGIAEVIENKKLENESISESIKSDTRAKEIVKEAVVDKTGL